MYWLVSLPGDPDEVWRSLQKATGNGSLSQNYRFELPMSLRVGSLDTLMVLSDELARVNATVEGVVNKIRRQVSELAPDQTLQVNGRPVTSYLTGFTWDEAKYPLRKPLKDIVDELTEVVVSIDDELKSKTATYQAAKQVYAAANRKSGGSLAVKDLRGLVATSDVVETENLTTLVVTVPSYNKKEFQATYERWCELVVPRSAKTVAEDGDYSLQRVLIFRKMVDDFKQAARTKGCQCREMPRDEEAESADDGGGADDAPDAAAQLRELGEALENKRAEVATWCRSSYGDAFAAWLHICGVRLFVESVLRYGLPPKFLGTVVQPHGKHEQKTRRALGDAFAGSGAEFWRPSEDAGAAEKEMFPYVSFTLDLDL